MKTNFNQVTASTDFILNNDDRRFRPITPYAGMNREQRRQAFRRNDRKRIASLARDALMSELNAAWAQAQEALS